MKTVTDLNSLALLEREFSLSQDSWEEFLYPVLTEEERGLVEKYKEGVKILILNYNKPQQPHLRSEIDNFGTAYCDPAGLQYEMAHTESTYFSDIRDSVFLRDRYGSIIIKGLDEVCNYAMLLSDIFYQKNSIIPRMRSKLVEE